MKRTKEFLYYSDIFHMKIQLAIATILTAGCVTVDVGSNKPEPAKNVSYTDPTAPFQQSQSKNADRLWVSTTTGNTISFLSDCGGTQEPTLEQLENDALGSLVDLKIITTEKFEYNSREALKTLAEGKVDGIKVKMSLLTLKKNNCNYTLIYGGVVKNFEKELHTFHIFVRGFKAP